MAANLTSVAAPAAVKGRLRGFLSGAREIDDAPVEVRGTLPGWLRGRLLLNGPALWDLPNGSYRHWFDGQAMFHRIRLGPGEARYRSRFQQSEDYRASIAAGRPAIGGFGQPDPETFLQRMSHFGKPRTTDNGAVVMGRVGDVWVAQTETPRLNRFDPETLQTLARTVNCSVHHLSQVINAGFGKSFFDFLNQYRVEHAKALLSDCEAPGAVLNVAFAVGFSSNSAFYAAFKKHVGQTPARYRRTVRR